MSAAEVMGPVAALFLVTGSWSLVQLILDVRTSPVW